MITKTVKAGDPIKASWANDLLAEVYKPNGTYTPTSDKTVRCRTNNYMANDAAFAIRYSYGTYTINAGSIYINNLLISPPNKDSENSYNMFSSIKKWEQNNKYVQTAPDDIPIWYIIVTYPNVVTQGNIIECVAELVIKHQDQQEPQQPMDLPIGYKWKCIKVNTVQTDEVTGFKHLRQLISGSIYISQRIPSLIQGDGISIRYVQPDILEISSNGDGGGSNVVLKQGEFIDIQNTPNGNTTEYTIHSYFVSVIGSDGINVTSSQHGRTTEYAISLESTILPDFDPEWFIIQNNVVTFNTEKLLQLAEDIAATATVNVNVTGIVDEVKTGSVQVDTTGIQNGTVTTNVSIV